MYLFSFPKTGLIFLVLSALISMLSCAPLTEASNTLSTTQKLEVATDTATIYVDSSIYLNKVRYLANGDTTGKWPVKKQPLPLKGALLPYHRIVAFYGNLYSKRMGILGELPPKEMLIRLDKEVKRWQEADTASPVIPALHYIAVTAQGEPGRDGRHRLRMPDQQIDSILRIAEKRPHMLVFLDIQVALSTLEQELPRLEKYLKLPHVHLGIDPEFSMKDASRPGSRIGTFYARDVNYAADFLSTLVSKYHLPPKLLIVHRFTKNMLQNYQDIHLKHTVQFIIDMDGWGTPALKRATYKQFIFREPVQFTGFKLFYKNDMKQAPKRLLTPSEILKLTPIPSYIQYQ